VQRNKALLDDERLTRKAKKRLLARVAEGPRAAHPSQRGARQRRQVTQGVLETIAL